MWDHLNSQIRWTLFEGYLFKYCSIKYQTSHQVPEKTSQQVCSHQKPTWKAFQMPPSAFILLNTLDCTNNVSQLYCTLSDIVSLRMCLDCTQHTFSEGWQTTPSRMGRIISVTILPHLYGGGGGGVGGYRIRTFCSAWLGNFRGIFVISLIIKEILWTSYFDNF